MLDYRTIAFMLPVTGLCVTLGLGLYWRAAPRLPGLAHWVAGFALFSMADMLWTARPLLPNLISASVGSALGLAGLAIMGIGLERYRGVTAPLHWLWGIVAVTVVANVACEVAGWGAWRIALTDLGFAALIGGLAVFFWRAPAPGWVRWLAAGINSVMAGIVAGRTVYYMTPDVPVALFDEALLAGPVFLVAFVWLLLLGFSFVMLTGARNEADLQANVAELRQAKQATEAALAEAEQARAQMLHHEKMAALGNLVTGIGHELNTPVGTALTASSHLGDEVAEVARRFDDGTLRRADMTDFLKTARDTSALIQSNIERTAALVNGFKALAADPADEERRQFDLKSHMDDSRPLLEPRFRAGGHALAIEVPAGLWLDSYPGALFRVLDALADNAVAHAFPDGRAGTFTVSAEAEDAAAVLVRAMDDGVGIPPELRHRVFEPFFTTGRGAGHSGLGLHVVYNLVMKPLGGTVWLEEGPAGGTCITLRLPHSAPPR